jgi:signal transduction histidine kinase
MPDSAMQEMVYSISHDFGRPLRQIMAFTDLLTDKHAADLDEESAEWFAYLSRAGAEAQLMLERLLVYSRMQGHQSQPADVNLIALAHECTALIDARNIDHSGGIEITCDIAEDVCIDRDLLQSALLELLDNAMSYGGPGPVNLSFDGKNTQLSVTVTDTGTGIDDDRMATALRPFGRLRAEQAGHVGLGLNIAQRAAEALGGELALQQSPGAFSATISAAI